MHRRLALGLNADLLVAFRFVVDEHWRFLGRKRQHLLLRAALCHRSVIVSRPIQLFTLLRLFIRVQLSLLALVHILIIGLVLRSRERCLIRGVCLRIKHPGGSHRFVVYLLFAENNSINECTYCEFII